MAKIHAFNTGRLYTEHGQRIAWCVLSTGNVAMWDRDRFIDYVLPFPVESPPVRDSEILAAYDRMERAPYNEAEYREAHELQSALNEAAGRCKSLKDA
jgi:hypothetical protein